LKAVNNLDVVQVSSNVNHSHVCSVSFVFVSLVVSLVSVLHRSWVVVSW
jgi:hypothetical protein